MDANRRQNRLPTLWGIQLSILKTTQWLSDAIYVKQDDIILRNKGGVARIWTFIESHDKEGAKGQV